MNVFNLGEALEKIKEGLRVARQGWNGQDMFIYYVPANSYPPSTDAALNYFGGHVPYEAYIAFKTTDDRVVPWVASQIDILAEDYYIVTD